MARRRRSQSPPPGHEDADGPPIHADCGATALVPPPLASSVALPRSGPVPPPPPPPPPPPAAAAATASKPGGMAAEAPAGPAMRKLHLGEGKLALARSAARSGRPSPRSVVEAREELVALFGASEPSTPRPAMASRAMSGGISLPRFSCSTPRRATSNRLASTHSPRALSRRRLRRTPSDSGDNGGGGGSGGGKGDAELAGALRIVDALASGDADALTHDQLQMLVDLLPSDEDCSLVRAYEGPVDTLGVVERFTRACYLVPFCRERAGAMLARAVHRARGRPQ